ncbi:type VI secretion system baseplate subunit TssG [Microbulbifer hydrolyticus]|uniref:Type VI secretion system baseplate subunit TssG n=1 Tax=Microbulbifer hydrolyticus TaxID=48074 RepID=A0A6P1T839_9GAMM|nr:type VI secretion system baseplate subunit TssG [Microbulbifer hydrolyticus]MBB5211391.1 type VI secretion system protein ImpH [Microbulbifer hydrolyticus]QHQ37853.1 type VI secretion system baseplate subunit TssG [Microbulbifer hydrolyticus]
MATSRRRQSTVVIDNLESAPYEYEFFQAVRLLEMAALQDEHQSHGVSVGDSAPPSREFIRFSAQTSLSFVSADVLRLEGPGRRKKNTESGSEAWCQKWEMEVGFTGLAGSQGVLPYYLTETLQRELKAKNSALKEFLDIFHHRHVSLLYRAWQKYQMPVNYEIARLRGDKDPDLFSQAISSVAGLGTSEMRYRLPLPDDALLGMAGLLGRQQCSAVSLKHMIRCYFGLEVAIEQFQGRWDALPEDVLTRLPCDQHPQGVNNRLGLDTIVGTHCFQAQNKFRVVIEPMGYEDHMAMAPGGRKLEALKAFIQLSAGVEMDFEIAATLYTEQVAPVQLSLNAATQPLLGWNSHMAAEQKDGKPVIISLGADQLSPDEALPTA